MLINSDIIRSPSNWFLVAFSAILLIFIFHIFNKGKA